MKKKILVLILEKEIFISIKHSLNGIKIKTNDNMVYNL